MPIICAQAWPVVQAIKGATAQIRLLAVASRVRVVAGRRAPARFSPCSISARTMPNSAATLLQTSAARQLTAKARPNPQPTISQYRRFWVIRMAGSACFRSVAGVLRVYSSTIPTQTTYSIWVRR